MTLASQNRFTLALMLNVQLSKSATVAFSLKNPLQSTSPASATIGSEINQARDRILTNMMDSDLGLTKTIDSMECYILTSCQGVALDPERSP